MKLAVNGGAGFIRHHVVEAARRSRHEVRLLACSAAGRGTSIEGLRPALDAVEGVIDLSSSLGPGMLQGAQPATLGSDDIQEVAAEEGVRHIVALSTVGADQSTDGHLRATLAREEAILTGQVPSTVVRSTMFHETTALLAEAAEGTVVRVPDCRVQTIAARAVGEVLVELVSKPPAGRVPDLAGPRRTRLGGLVRTLLSHRGLDTDIVVDDPGDAPSLLPASGARIEGPGFKRWLTSPDARAVLV